MKRLTKVALTFFIAFQLQVNAQDGQVRTTNKVDTNDLAAKILKKINACENVSCFVTFYNSMAKVTSGFSNKESGHKIIAEILKLIDKKQDGVLFDLYMHSKNKYRKYFITCAKLLPTDLQSELRRKSQEYLDRNKN